MKGDRFLLSILIGTIVIAVLAVALFLLRKGAVQYADESTPQGVVQNYALALFKKEYDRAYTYLADDANKPDLARFKQAFLSKQVDPSSTSLQVGEVSYSGDHAFPTLTINHASQDLFTGVFPQTETSELVRQNGKWKLLRMPYPYWNFDWYQPPANPQPAKPLP